MKKTLILLTMASGLLLGACGHHVMTDEEVSSWEASSSAAKSASKASSQKSSSSKASSSSSSKTSASTSSKTSASTSSSKTSASTSVSTSSAVTSSSSVTPSTSTAPSISSSTATVSSSEVPTPVDYTLTIGGVNVPLAGWPDAPGPKETWIEQYYAENIDVTAGAKIQFSHQGTPINSGIGANEGKNNVVGHSDNITVHNDAVGATIYFQVYSDGYGIWLTGYEAGGGGGDTPTEGVTVTFKVNYKTNYGDAIYILGDFTEWATGAIRGECVGEEEWNFNITKPEGTKIAYKYAVAAYENPNITGDSYEKGGNREYTFPAAAATVNDSWQAA